MSQGKIYALIPKVMKEVGAIGKNGFNPHDKYKFRSIDDVYNSLQGPLSNNGVFFLPEVLEHKDERVQSAKGHEMVRTTLKVKYTVYADDGSFVVAIVCGEAIDRSDKSVNKALTAAFKYMLIQIFCIAVEGQDDSDKESPQIYNNNGASEFERVFDDKSQEPEKAPTCPICGEQMLTSKNGQYWYCRNWKNKSDGEHPTIKKAV